MEGVRRQYQGVLNIIKFNWHYYVLAGIFILLVLCLQPWLPRLFQIALDIIVLLLIGAIATSLIVSFYIYDLSDLYKFSWLEKVKGEGAKNIVNINAGFDETSIPLKKVFAESQLSVMDFYDPLKHTEISIKRARRKHHPFPGTRTITTNHLPIEDGTTYMVLAILSAHEIRDHDERVLFFSEVKRVLSPSGSVIVTEHMRDIANLFAYNIGFLHFHSRATWLNTFHSAGLSVREEIKITPFVTTFILSKNGAAH